MDFQFYAPLTEEKTKGNGWMGCVDKAMDNEDYFNWTLKPNEEEKNRKRKVQEEQNEAKARLAKFQKNEEAKAQGKKFNGEWEKVFLSQSIDSSLSQPSNDALSLPVALSPRQMSQNHFIK